MLQGLRCSIAARFPTTTFYSRIRPFLREVVESSFVRDDLEYVGRPGARLTKLTSASLDKAMAAREYRTWYLASEAEFPPQVSLKCHRLEDTLGLDITFRETAWQRYGTSLAADFEALTSKLVERFGAQTCFSGGVHLFDDTVPVPKVLTTTFGPFGRRAVIDLFDRRHLKLPGDPAWTAMLRKLVQAPLPKTVRVSDDGEVIQRFWTDDLGDERALRAACKRSQQWLVKTLAKRR